MCSSHVFMVFTCILMLISHAILFNKVNTFGPFFVIFGGKLFASESGSHNKLETSNNIVGGHEG